MQEKEPTGNLHDLDNLLPSFSADIEATGLVGEKLNAQIVFLASLSARLDDPLHVSIHGASSAGKNFLINRVSRFIPPDHQKHISGMSPKWLNHSKTDEIKHKVLYIAEYEGVSGADFAIRTFQSEKRIEWNYVDNENGIKNKTNVLEGPAAFIQTTTKPLLHDENETRLLFIDLDETPDQTALILREAAKECAYGGHFGSSLSMENWHDHILGLQPLHVIIPFAQDLAEHFPHERIRSRRDFPKLLSLIKVSAFLHQKRRERDDEELIASPLDYQITKPLFEHCYGMGPDNNIRALMEVAQKQNKPFKVSGLLTGTGWRKSKTYEVLNRAEDLGLIATGERRGTYEFVRMPSECPLQLPDSVELS